VFLDPSALILAAVVAMWMYGTLQGVIRDGALAAALIAVPLFMASILLHELGHALTSLAFGIPVLRITLFGLGGVTESVAESRSPAREFAIVGAGPGVSLVLAGLFFATATATSSLFWAGICVVLAYTNLALGLFNILPAYPLDGGRLLRSVLWAVTRREHQATRWAARTGQFFAVLFGASGVWAFMQSGGAGFNALWRILIAIFLFRGASDAHRQAAFRQRLADRSLREVMGTAPPPIAPETPLDQALEQVQTRPSQLWPVGDPLVGVLRMANIDAVPQAQWPTTTAVAVADPPLSATVDVSTPLDAAVQTLAKAPGQMVLITDAGRTVGLLTPSLLGDLLQA
jgi:Zn-dependent protease